MVSVPDVDLLRSIVGLRRAVRGVDAVNVALELHDVECRLRRAAGPSIPKRVAARLLAVSVSALDDLVNRGLLPVVVRDGSTRSRIATLPLIQLAVAVEDDRARTSARGVLVRAIAALGWREVGHRVVIREDIARLPRPNVSAAELRHEFESTTAEQRVLAGMKLSATMSRIAIAGEAMRRGA